MASSPSSSDEWSQPSAATTATASAAALPAALPGPSSSGRSAVSLGYVPFQLTDEMYANIYRRPAAFGYPEVATGSVSNPKYGLIFIETREAGARRPKLLDGLDWIPSSAANAKHKLLRDGKTELVRHYCSRRTKHESAKPASKPYVFYNKEVVDQVKRDNPGATTYEIKAIVGAQWRALPETSDQKIRARAAAAEANRYHRQRLSMADPQQLLVRHEMWLQAAPKYDDDDDSTDGEGEGEKLPRLPWVELAPTRVLVHYLGDDAFQSHGVPPVPARLLVGPDQQPRSSGATAATAAVHDGGGDDDNDGIDEEDDGEEEPPFCGKLDDVGVATTSLQLSLHCRVAPQSLPLMTCNASESDVLGLHVPPAGASSLPASPRPPMSRASKAGRGRGAAVQPHADGATKRRQTRQRTHLAAALDSPEHSDDRENVGPDNTSPSPTGPLGKQRAQLSPSHQMAIPAGSLLSFPFGAVDGYPCSDDDAADAADATDYLDEDHDNAIIAVDDVLSRFQDDFDADDAAQLEAALANFARSETPQLLSPAELPSPIEERATSPSPPRVILRRTRHTTKGKPA